MKEEAGNSIDLHKVVKIQKLEIKIEALKKAGREAKAKHELHKREASKAKSLLDGVELVIQSMQLELFDLQYSPPTPNDYTESIPDVW
mgnify:FL=1